MQRTLSWFKPSFFKNVCKTRPSLSTTARPSLVATAIFPLSNSIQVLTELLGSPPALVILLRIPSSLSLPKTYFINPYFLYVPIQRFPSESAIILLTLIPSSASVNSLLTLSPSLL